MSIRFIVLATTLVNTFASPALADGSVAGSIVGTVEAKPSKFLPDTIFYVKEVPNTKLAAKAYEIDQQGWRSSLTSCSPASETP